MVDATDDYRDDLEDLEAEDDPDKRFEIRQRMQRSYISYSELQNEYRRGNPTARAIMKSQLDAIGTLRNKEGKLFFETVYNTQKKRIFNALKNSSSDSVIKFKDVLKKIIDGK